MLGRPSNERRVKRLGPLCIARRQFTPAQRARFVEDFCADVQLGLPQLKMADGPVGIRNSGSSTSYPAGICMAATWDPELVERIGEMLGKDARARGVHFLLAP